MASISINMLTTVSYTLSVPVNDAPSAVTRLSQCIADVAEWLSASRLHFNPDKTVIMWLGSKHSGAAVVNDDCEHSP